MAFNNEIEKVKSEIKVLESKLALLEEMEKHKSPEEEAFKRWMNVYPPTTPGVDNIDDIRWRGFQMGYDAAKKDWKVGEYMEELVGEPEELKTLYQMLADGGWHPNCDVLCDLVKEWMYQYDCDYASCQEYLEGYTECQTVLEERLK